MSQGAQTVHICGTLGAQVLVEDPTHTPARRSGCVLMLTALFS